MQTGKLWTIFRIQSVVLLILSISMIIPLCISIYNTEENCTKAFSVVILVGAILGFVGYKLVPTSDIKLKNRDGFLVVTLMWLLASLVGSLPFILSGEIPNVLDAIFETISGFTTTGATILDDPQTLAPSMLFWRSLTHWLGGMGIVVLVMALLPGFGINGQIVANAETPGPTKEKYTSRFSDTAKGFYKIYVGFTLGEVLLLKIGGMSLFDAFIYSFGTVSTGGFSAYSDNVGHFSSPFIQIVISVFMILSVVNYNLFLLTRKRGLRAIFRDEEFRFFLGLLAVFTFLVIGFNLIMTGFNSPGQTALDGWFQVSSIISSTGYSTVNYNLWPAFSKFVLLMLFLGGGCSLSASAGLKSIRLLVGLKLIHRSFSLRLHPNRIARITLNNVELSNDVVIRISNFIFLYIAVATFGMILISINNYDFITSLSASLACLGNVGPGFGSIGPGLGYGDFSWFSKLVCSFLMILGRLEIYTVTALFSRRYWNSNIV